MLCPAKEKIKVLIADDHEIVRIGVLSALEDLPDIEVVAEATTGEEAVSLAQKYSPNIVLMDLRMPGIGGIEATREITKSNSDIGVLIFTIYNDEFLSHILFDAGARGYLTKEGSYDELIKAIYAVNNGQVYLSSVVKEKFAKQNEENEHNPFEKLSTRELQVAAMILKSESTKEIAAKLAIKTKTIATYRRRIYLKLNIKSEMELLYAAIQYKFHS